jgi:subtilisin family serine protease
MVCATAVAVVVPAAGVGAQPGAPAAEFIVVFEDGVDPAAKVSELAGDGVVGGSDVVGVYDDVLNGSALRLDAGDVAELTRDPQVRSVTPNIPVFALTSPAAATPTNTQGSVRWHLDRLDTNPTNGTFTYPTNPGEGVTIYVVDSPLLTTHTEFAGRASHLGFQQSLCTPDQGGPGWHGTGVAAMAAGRTLGVAKEATVVSVGALGCDGAATLQDVLDAFELIHEQHPVGQPGVVNMSFGAICIPTFGEEVSACGLLDEALLQLKTRGLVLVAAAGNDGSDYGCGVYPGGSPHVISAGAVNSANARSSFSNSGACTDVYAPGENVTLASYESTTARTTNNGTSFSAPLVAGVAAVILGKNPALTPDQVAANVYAGSLQGGVTGVPAIYPNRLLRFTPQTWSRSTQIGAAPHATASPTQCGFADAAVIPSWARQATCWSKGKGITTVNPFNPNGLLTRAEMAAFLWRAAGQPAGPSTCGVVDAAKVPAWARVPVCWMLANGITTNNPYNPQGTLTSAQLITFLDRAGYRQPDVVCPGPVGGHTDDATIPNWAKNSANWAYTQRITTSTTFAPGTLPTRADMAAFLWRANASP